MPQICPLPYLYLTGPGGTVYPGWRLHTFDAGTSNPRATFGNAAGTITNPNPVVADAQGRMAVWLLEGASYRLSMRDADDAVVWEADDIVGVGSGTNGGGTPATASEWLVQPDAPTFIAADQYSLQGDQTFEFHVGRRQRAQVGGGLSYATITASTFDSNDTIVTVAVDSGSAPIDAGISAVELGINSAAPGRRSIHQDAIEGLNLSGKIIGEIRMWTTLVAPPGGWLLCDGSAVDRTTYAALFAVIGEAYGAGDGSTTFNVPDFRGRSPVGAGQSPDSGEGGTPGNTRVIGQKMGSEWITLTSAQSGVPAHTHPQEGGNFSVGDFVVGTGAAIAGSTTGFTSQNTAQNAAQSHENQSPGLGVSFIIAH